MDSRANSCSINWLEFAHLLNVRHPSAPHNRHSSGQLTAEGSKPRAGGEGGGILVRHYRATHCSSESDFARILRGMGGGTCKLERGSTLKDRGGGEGTRQ